MEAQGVDALIVPTDDPHLSEYVPDCFARRAFVSGFTGSTGTALVLRAAEDSPPRLWTDGRYFLQAERQLPVGWELMRSGVEGTPTMEEWLASNMRPGQVVGIDPAVHPASVAVDLRQRLENRGVAVRCLETNPADVVWGDARPGLPMSTARLHPERFAGRSAVEKLSEVRQALEREGADALIVSALDEVAYLLNVRGGDVHRTPVLLSFAIVERDSATLFVDEAKLPPDVRTALASAGVGTRPYHEALEAVKELAEANRKVWLDPARTNFALFSALGDSGGPRVRKPSPLSAMKATKNAAELDGMHAAHRRDGAALAEAFCRLEALVREGTSEIDEVGVDALVTECRRSQQDYLDNSFDTIAGYGPNGAIIHYRAEPGACALLGTDALLLLDSGAQYLDGTTDVTRTMHFGTPSAREKECFTRVLKGHIALATAVFPEGTPGFVVDAFARRPLWAAGLDYRHGTGHGVGAALAVHEGPQKISPHFDIREPLKAGMIVSNEPGYYEDRAFGIRIENLLVIVERQTPNNFGGKKYLGFEPLTLAPIQRSLIDVNLLDDEELAYINAYHARVHTEVAPLLEQRKQVLTWLHRATGPIER